MGGSKLHTIGGMARYSVHMTVKHRRRFKTQDELQLLAIGLGLVWNITLLISPSFLISMVIDNDIHY